MSLKPVIIIIICLGLIAPGATALANSQEDALAATMYLMAKNEKAKKEHKIKKEKKKGPSDRAYERANPNAKFKRYEDYTPQEQETIKKKKWSEMSEEEKGAVHEHYKKSKEKIDEIMRGKKTLGEVLLEGSNQ